MNGITNKILSKQIQGGAMSEINDLDGSPKVWAQRAERREDIYQVLFEVQNLKSGQ